jgi:hypothetical protein
MSIWRSPTSDEDMRNTVAGIATVRRGKRRDHGASRVSPDQREAPSRAATHRDLLRGGEATAFGGLQGRIGTEGWAVPLPVDR